MQNQETINKLTTLRKKVENVRDKIKFKLNHEER